MPNPKSCPVTIRIVAVATACALTAACGGGGSSSNPISTPAPPPAPPPPAPPPPPPSPNFNTQEFRDSDGPGFHNAITAWEAGYTGTGSIIAVIDSGIDSDSPEFAGRIHSDSQDVVGARGIDGPDDHGTNVAMVAAAARDDTGILGIAFDAQVLALRADDPGTCPADCTFDDVYIAAGVDQAIASGATVINLSLGGGAASQVLLDAVARAAAAGIVVVVSAGNGGDGSEPGIDPNQPDPFASSLLHAGNGNVIIVGSVDANGNYSDFSNRAGNDAGSYLVARGENICCVYVDGQLLVETVGNQQFVTVFSGTSFSAPQVAGAVALLAQAFPNLTATEIVDILLSSARDAGAVGTDEVFGRGILDIAAALQPQGTTTLAGTDISLALYQDMAIGSAAMGDALGNVSGGQGPQAIVLDKYRRAYRYDLSGGVRSVASITPRLRNAVERQGRSLAAHDGSMSLAFTVGNGARAAGLEWAGPLRLSGDDAQRAQMIAARVALRLSNDTQIGLALKQGASGLVAQLQGQSRPAFMIAPDTGGDDGFFQQSHISFAMRRKIGALGVTLHGESGEAWLGSSRRIEGSSMGFVERYPTMSFGLSFDREIFGVEASLGLSWLQERDTVLGGYFHPAFGAQGADSAIADVKLRRNLGQDWQVGASWRQAYTHPRSSGILEGSSHLVSSAWALDVTRSHLFGQRDTLGLRVSQPLRVASGGLDLNLPVAYDYASESTQFAPYRLSLAPNGREIIGELGWRGPLLWGTAAMSLFYRRQPGHFANAPGDAGGLVSWNAEF